MRLNVNGNSFETSPENTVVYTFIGAAGLLNHVFLITGEKDGSPSGGYVFESLREDNKLFRKLYQVAAREGYPAHLNMHEAPECDFNEYVRRSTRDLRRSSGVPEEWL